MLLQGCVRVHSNKNGVKQPFVSPQAFITMFLHILKIIVHIVFWNWYTINNKHWQKSRGKFENLEHHIFQETTVYPATFSFLLNPESSLVVMISPIQIAPVPLRRKGALPSDLLWKLWYTAITSIRITNQNTTQLNNTPVLTDVQTINMHTAVAFRNSFVG